MSVAMIFSAFNATTSIAGYLGLIDSVNSNVKKLLNQAFKSAVQNLEYARTASASEQRDYIKRARDKFIDAIAVEENENLISSLLGLSMCQHLLNDTANARRTFERIKDVQLTTPEKIKAGLKGYGKDLLVPWSFRLLFGRTESQAITEYQMRQASFEEYKNSALSIK